MNAFANAPVLHRHNGTILDRVAKTDTNGPAPGLKILNGWKEIANHLGRGVRTVQRWEALGLPVRRPTANLRSPVFATVRELDAWLVSCGTVRREPANGSLVAGTVNAAEIEQLRRDVAELRRELSDLRAIVGPAPPSPRTMD